MRESDIRPEMLFDRYLRLAEQDAGVYFGETPRVKIACPACGRSGRRAFRKIGFDYRECTACDTLYVSPRPPADAFFRYYRESPSARFWATEFYRVTADARREKLWKPKAGMVWEFLCAHNARRHAVIDVGGGYGIFAEEYAKASGSNVTVIEPGPALAEICSAKGVSVVPSFLEMLRPEQLPRGAKAFVAFELIEHLHDPGFFMQRLASLMQTGDIFLMTTLSGTGLDIRALWDRSKAIFPPHHINFFNPYSIRILLEYHGFEVLESSTPGKLDTDILRNHAGKIRDRFWNVFLKRANPEQMDGMQRLVAGAGFSSHMLVAARKT